ncbi:MAG: DUF294 nucleotidyltransferase-like domain-containing protein [Candidatus Krumholzibacteriia bacterium]
MIARIMDFLSTQHPFMLLSRDELEAVRRASRTSTLPAGTVILSQGGAVSPCLHLIAAGSVRLTRDGVEIQILEEGDCFGYPSIISQDAPAFDVVAAEDVTLHCVPAAVFKGLLGNGPFAEFFLKSLGERLSRLTQREVTSIGGELTAPLASLLKSAPVTVPATATVADAARAMRDRRTDVVLVEGMEPGILTDHDFQVKVLAEGRGPQIPVAEVMSRPVKTLPGDTPVHTALLFMLEEKIHHLPVTGDGAILGIVSATDLLRQQTRNPLYLMRNLDNLESAAGLGNYAGDTAAMVNRLFNGGLKVAQIGRILASVNDALIRRLCRLAELQLGPAPCPYAFLVFGSEGRMEQALLTDQDNALVYAEESPAAAAYFPEFAATVVGNLITAGFPPCTGGCMATNWCRTVDGWDRTVAEWIRSPTPDNLMVASIFFDFRAVAGSLDTAPIADRVAGAVENQLFMAHLARVSLRFKPPLGLFRRIRSTDGRIDLKKRGLAPIAAAARVFALEARARSRPTRERLEAAMAFGNLSRDLGQTLIETYRFLLQLRLQEQLVEMRTGGEVDNEIRLASLSSLEHRHLKDAFGAIQEMQQAVAQRFRTNQLA